MERKTTLSKDFSFRKVVDGKLVYEIKDGVAIFPGLGISTPCQKAGEDLKKCFQDMIAISFVLVPYYGDNWNYYETATLIVRIKNNTKVYDLTNVDVKLTVSAKFNKADIRVITDNPVSVSSIKPHHPWFGYHEVKFTLRNYRYFEGEDILQGKVDVTCNPVLIVTDSENVPPEVIFGAVPP